MTKEQIAASMADALASIAGLPTVDPELDLTIAQVTSAYNEARQIAQEALDAYNRFTGQEETPS